MENLIVELKRTDLRVHFDVTSALHPDQPIPCDYTPPLGTGNGFAGLELLLFSFCGCVSTAIVALLLRMGKHIAAYSVHAEGERTEQPLSLRRILFHVSLESQDAQPEDLDAVMKQAEQISPVWIAIRNNVIIETSYEIL